ncbi:hypothetical protein KKG83_02470 [Candidatus Micrarchaeota archaeon]|nr:hypothetical protein [Candidatus Micrarchaeota archaeon]MBU2476314.1 hypothetical protein [Candidatus Micrarchaeota archaeon]
MEIFEGKANKKIAEEVLDFLMSGETQKINEAVKTLNKMLHQHYDEKWSRISGQKATKTLEFLRDEFLKMGFSQKPETRYAGLRGLSTMQISDIFEEKINEMLELFLKTIVDESGKVRCASANAFGSIRPLHGKFTESMYAELYMVLIGLFDGETDKKKKKSIENALNKLYCPHLEICLNKNGCKKTEQKNFYAA